MKLPSLVFKPHLITYCHFGMYFIAFNKTSLRIFVLFPNYPYKIYIIKFLVLIASADCNVMFRAIFECRLPSLKATEIPTLIDLIFGK